MKITDSLDRILSAEQIFGQRFYDQLLRLHPEVRHFFQNVNMNRQAIRFTALLTLIESNYRQRNVLASQYLRALGTSHNSMDIPCEVYPQFRDVLLDALANFEDGHWDDELAEQWRTAIEQAIQVMLDQYRESNEQANGE